MFRYRQEACREGGVQVRAPDRGQSQVGEGLRQADQEAREGAGGHEEEAPEGAFRGPEEPVHGHRETRQIQGKVSSSSNLERQNVVFLCRSEKSIAGFFGSKI